MQLSQSALFYLSCASFLAGLMLSLLYDVLYSTRIWLMPSPIRYSVPAIQKMRASRAKKGNAKKAKGLPVAVFLGDVLFCIVSALALILWRQAFFYGALAYQKDFALLCNGLLSG